MERKIFIGKKFTLGFCACGCGTEIDVRNKHSCLLVRFVFGHHKVLQTRKNNPFWKGGRYITRLGYVMIRTYNHQFTRRRKYMFEHRLIMENHLGRKLTNDEIVHHINGIKTDNRIENLELTRQREHQYLHHKIDMSNRFCCNCKASKTSRWNRNSERTGYLCQKCYRKQSYLRTGK